MKWHVTAAPARLPGAIDACIPVPSEPYTRHQILDASAYRVLSAGGATGK